MTAGAGERRPGRARSVGGYDSNVILSRLPRVPAWFVVPVLATRVFGVVLALWAGWKLADSVVPRMCGDPAPIQELSGFMAMGELGAGVLLATGATAMRACVGLAGTGAMTGIVGFALVARARGLPTRHCGCFGGIDLPWSAHAAIAATLALAFLAILLDAERRLAETGGRA